MFDVPVIQKELSHHSSFYLYHEKKILEATTQLKESFPTVEFLYSMKTNANPSVVDCVLSQGFGVDAASVAEVMAGVARGVPQHKIQFSAPGKSKKHIEETIDHAILVADSLNEVQLIQTVAQEKGIVATIGIRVHPSFSFLGGAATPSKFGVDEEQFLEALPVLDALPNLEIRGIHIHVQSQELSHQVLTQYYTNQLTLVRRAQEKAKHPFTFLNMGSGIGIPYSLTDAPLDVPGLGQTLTGLLKEFLVDFPEMGIYVETGRYAVGKSGVYVTTVLDKKVSRGKTFVILENTLNGFIRPSLEQLVRKYSGESTPAASEPLFTKENAFQFIALTQETQEETVTLVGNLCTAADVVATDITLPILQVGNAIVITNAGSYAAVLSPMQFSSQIPPAELFCTSQGDVITYQK